MSVHPFPIAANARRRLVQQQQPGRMGLNRQQQQEGYSEFQHGQAAPARGQDAEDAPRGRLPVAQRIQF